MAAKQTVSHPALDNLTLARIINRLHGGNVIAAWEVDQLDDVWLDVFLGVGEELPKKQQRQRLIAQKFKEFESEHPTFGKYRQRQ